MNVKSAALARWSGRTLGILFAIFLGLFASDSQGVIGFLIHLIPSFLIIASVALAWKWPALGAAAFMIMAVAATAFFHTYRDGATLLLITGPYALVGALFFLQSRQARASDVRGAAART